MAHIAGTRKGGSAEMLEILNTGAEKYVEFCGWYCQMSVPLVIAQTGLFLTDFDGQTYEITARDEQARIPAAFMQHLGR